MINRDIEILAAPEMCRRCDGALLFSVQVPHSFVRPDGGEVHGRRTVPLCPRCERDVPAAQGLLAYFTVNETATTETVGDLAALLAEWLEHAARPPAYTEADLDEEIRQWEDGDM
jgi:hypothetical protein